jgi:hypothetical protein
MDENAEENALEDLEIKAVGRNRGPNEYLRSEQDSYFHHYKERMEGMDEASFARIEEGRLLFEDAQYVYEANKVGFVFSNFCFIIIFLIFYSLFLGRQVVRQRIAVIRRKLHRR